MNSGWIIKFKDGGKLFLSEEAYEENTIDKSDVICEEHWLDMVELKKNYPWVNLKALGSEIR